MDYRKVRTTAMLVAVLLGTSVFGGHTAAAGGGSWAGGTASGAPRTDGRPDQSKPLTWQADPDGDGPIKAGDRVAGSKAEIWRHRDGVSFRIHTTGLDKGHGYTVWFFAYNSPGSCTSGEPVAGARCTRADLFNPAARGSLMWGRSGLFVTGTSATFVGYRPLNSTPCAPEPAVATGDCGGVMIGNGLSDPAGAEIHFVLRDHGPDQPDVDDEITTINGGCDPVTFHGIPVFGPGWGTPGDFACHDPQFEQPAPAAQPAPTAPSNPVVAM